MNYEKIYFDFIKSRKEIIRKKGKDVYYERHHIIPRSLMGINNEENLVLLTAKEHFFAHLLLVRIYAGKEKVKMIYALWFLTRQYRNSYRENICSSRQYQYIKELLQKEKIGKTSKLKGRTYKDIYGDDGAKKRKEKSSLALKGKSYEELFGKVQADKLKLECRDRNLGKKYSKETKLKKSLSLKLAYKEGRRIPWQHKI